VSVSVRSQSLFQTCGCFDRPREVIVFFLRARHRCSITPVAKVFTPHDVNKDSNAGCWSNVRRTNVFAISIVHAFSCPQSLPGKARGTITAAKALYVPERVVCSYVQCWPGEKHPCASFQEHCYNRDDEVT